MALREHKEEEEVEEGSGCSIAMILAGEICSSNTDSDVSTDFCFSGEQSGEKLNFSLSSFGFLCVYDL